MKLKRVLSFVVLTTMFSGCSEPATESQSFDYDSLEVVFESLKGESSWKQEDLVGIYATCTRKGVEGTQMGMSSHCVFAPSDSTAYLLKTDEQSKVAALKGDHNFRFYAYLPYDATVTDPSAISVSVPSKVVYDPDNIEVSSKYFASSVRTSVISPVKLSFGRLDCTVTFEIPDNIIKIGGGTVLKSMVIKPAKENQVEGPLAYSATYNLLSGALDVDESTVSSSIEVDFGEGYQMQKGMTKVSVLMAPFTVPESGFDLLFTDTDGKTVTVRVWEEEYGKILKPGDEMLTAIATSEDIEVDPCASPVIWPVGYRDGVPVFTKDNQPLWRQWQGKVGAMESHVWTSTDQPQADIQFHTSDSHPEDWSILLENNQFPQYNYASPCVKGIWTGDYFEIRIPVKNFKANTRVIVTMPVFSRGAPLFWDIEYLDGKKWKASNQKEHESPDKKYAATCTWMIPQGNKGDLFEGYVMADTLKVKNAIRSNYLKIRMKCVDGTIITSAAASYNDACSQIQKPGTSNPFAFVNKSGICKEVRVEWE